MIKITFPDGSVREYNEGVNGLQIAESISSRLAQDVLACGVNGETYDLGRPINEDANFVLYKWDDEEGKHAFWHTSAHLLAEALQELSAGTDTQIATFDVKHQYDYLDRSSTEQYFDVLIAAYLLNPLKNDYDMEAIASEHLGILIPGRAEVFGKRDFRTLLSEDAGKAMEYACYGAYVSRKGKKVLKDKLEAAGMKCLMEEMEMPLSLVLYDMQKEGVAVKREELKAYGDALVARIEELEQSIHTQAGTEFNINSPKQLGEILFGKLGLPHGKKTKTGWSTNADVLEKLRTQIGEAGEGSPPSL